MKLLSITALVIANNSPGRPSDNGQWVHLRVLWTYSELRSMRMPHQAAKEILPASLSIGKLAEPRPRALGRKTSGD